MRASRYRGCLIAPGNRVAGNLMEHGWVAYRQNGEPFAFVSNRAKAKYFIDELLGPRNQEVPKSCGVYEKRFKWKRLALWLAEDEMKKAITSREALFSEIPLRDRSMVEDHKKLCWAANARLSNAERFREEARRRLT